MNRIGVKVVAGVFALTIGMALSSAPAHAAAKTKVDCDAVMQALNSGKKAKEVSAEMKISTSSIYRCKKKEMAAAKTSAKAGSEAAAKPAASPAASKP
jgi:hypothetical protein